MPEGPEAKCFSVDLSKEHKDDLLVEIARKKGRKKHEVIANFDELCSKLPLRVNKVYSVGKKVIWKLCNQEKENFYIVISLGRMGKFYDEYQKHCDFAFHFGEYFDNDKFSWALITKKRYFFDSIHDGQIYFLMSDEELESFLKKKVGIDLLDFALRKEAGKLKKNEEKLLEKKWLEKASGSKRSHWQIVQFMMKQEEFAGIGNYIKAESLFRAGVPPNVTLGDLVEDYPELLLQLLHRVLDVLLEAYHARGATLRDFVNLDGKKGDFQCLVYGKGYIKFKGTKHKVVKEKTADKRTTHWCPGLQKLNK